jgi:four helix bundle protein
MQDYRNLNVWKKAHTLAVTVYKITQKFPREETYSITSQIRRACISIPANIVEGCGRSSKQELIRFLQIASGSAHELEYHFLLAKDVGYLKLEDFSSISETISEIKKMLSVLMNKIEKET